MPAPADASVRPPLPDGPSAPSAVQGPLFARDPQGALLRARRRHGPVFTLRLPLVGPVVVVSTPDAVERIAARDPEAAHAGAARRGVLPQASTHSLFGSDGAEHRAVRARSAPPFHADRVDARLDAMVARAHAHVDTWPTGRPLALLSRMRTLAEDLFVRYVLGVEDDARARELTRIVGRILRTPGNPPMAPPDRHQAPPLGPLFHLEVRRRLRPLRAFLSREVADRRAGRVAPTGGLLDHVARTDLDDEQLVDELLVVLAAAQEPMAIALTRVTDRYARDERLADGLLADGPDAPAFDAVASEALRLHPPALASLRQLTAPVRIGDHELAPGTNVMVPFPLLHRDPAVFADPHRFDPARFLATPPPPTLLPFGVGERRCPGEPLAGVELRAVVPTVLRRLHLRPLSPAPERAVQRATVLVPHRSGLTLAHPRA